MTVSPGVSLPPGADQLGQTATLGLVKDQCERAVSQGNGTVLTNQMLVLDPVMHGHLLNRQHLRLCHVRYRNGLENEAVTVQTAERDPLSTGRAGAHIARGDETWHERRNRDSSPYGLNTSV